MSKIEWTEKTWRANPLTGRPGPAPLLPRDGDKRQARQRINVEVRSGRRPHPNDLACVDCGHVWSFGERRHEYDHHQGYGPDHHYNVEPVCTLCHAARDGKAARTHCSNGHEFTSENTIYPAKGGRACRECRRAYDKKRERPLGYWKKVNTQRRARHG